MATAVSSIIGERLRAWRNAERLRQEDIALGARDCGLGWTQATVAAIEGGRREVSLREFLALPLLVKKVGEALPLRLPPEHYNLAYFLDRMAVLMDTPPPDDAEDFIVAAAQPLDRSARIRIDAQGEAERKAARRFGTSPYDVAQQALNLWGRSLTDERERRVQARLDHSQTSAPALQAHRGHVTRELLDELHREFDLIRGNIDEHAIRLWGRSWDAELDARASDRGATDNTARKAIYREMAREIRPVMDAAAEAEED